MVSHSNININIMQLLRLSSGSWQYRYVHIWRKCLNPHGFAYCISSFEIETSSWLRRCRLTQHASESRQAARAALINP